MALPKLDRNTGKVTLSNGAELPLRGLSRSEALRIAEAGEDVPTVERMLLHYATETPADEVNAWYDEAPSADVQAIVNEVLKLSGLTDLPKELSAA